MSTQTANKLRSTNVYGSFNNYDTSTGSILASASFQRNVLIGNDLTLGLESLDASNNAIDTGGNIKFLLNKIPYSIPLRILSYLVNVSSDIQQQINNFLTSNGGNISSVGYLTQSLSDTSSTQFGNNAYNKTSTGVNNTSIGSSNLYKNTTGNYNTSVGFNSMAENTSGGGNTSVGYKALSNSITGNNNVSIGKNSGLSMIATTHSTCIGTNSDCAYSNSTALGFNSTCSANNQIMLGTINEIVVVPNDISFGGSINNISRTVFSYLSSASSNLQEQLDTLKQTTTDIQWISGTINRTNIRNGCSTSILTFSTSLNNISVNTFSFLSGVTSNIQNQINAINNVGMVIQFAGNASSLPGYLLCNGNQYSASSYPNLFNVIGDMYGGDSNQGWFNVPNYQGIFLRGAGSQNVNLNVIAGGGGAIQKTYTSPALGQIFPDETTQSTTKPFDDNITTTVRSFITSVSSVLGPPTYNFNYSNAVASMQFTASSETINNGFTETFPVHTSIQYFIKY